MKPAGGEKNAAGSAFVGGGGCDRGRNLDCRWCLCGFG